MPGEDTDQAATEELELEPATSHQTENTDTTQTVTRQERRDSTPHSQRQPIAVQIPAQQQQQRGENAEQRERETSSSERSSLTIPS